jgi:hypothetical protein
MLHTACVDRAGGLGLNHIGEEVLCQQMATTPPQVWRCPECEPARGPALRASGPAGHREAAEGEGGVSEEVATARRFLQLFARRDESSRIFEENSSSFIKSDQFNLRLRPAVETKRTQQQ